MNPKDQIGLTKAPLRLVPPALVIEVAAAMKNGAEKYGPYNWREQAVSLNVYIEAALRHIYAFMDGEEVAEDSGVKHIAHAAACLGIILDAASIDKLIDDRPTPGAAATLMGRQVQQAAVTYGPETPLMKGLREQLERLATLPLCDCPNTDRWQHQLTCPRYGT